MISKFLLVGGSVTNANVHQGFRDDRKVEERCSAFNPSCRLISKKKQTQSTEQ